MRDNLRAWGGSFAAEPLAIALAPTLGRTTAHSLAGELAARAAREGVALTDLASRDDRVTAVLTDGEIAGLADPAAHLGSTAAFIDRALDRWHRVDP
jgi:3-carboxy-cis,cis-muconate cycloisomerase